MTLFVALLEATLLVCSAQVPEPAPNLVINGVDGHSIVVRPEALQKPLLLHFFSLQDSGWQNELLRLKVFDARFEKKGLALISLAAPEPGAKEILEAFAIEQRIRFPIAIDSGNLSAFSRDRVPRTVLIAPDGTVALRQYEPPGYAQLREIEARLPGLFARRREAAERSRARGPRKPLKTEKVK